jgi:hypothetical protein
MMVSLPDTSQSIALPCGSLLWDTEGRPAEPQMIWVGVRACPPNVTASEGRGSKSSSSREAGPARAFAQKISKLNPKSPRPRGPVKYSRARTHEPAWASPAKNIRVPRGLISVFEFKEIKRVTERAPREGGLNPCRDWGRGPRRAAASISAKFEKLFFVDGGIEFATMREGRGIQSLGRSRVATAQALRADFFLAGRDFREPRIGERGSSRRFAQQHQCLCSLVRRLAARARVFIFRRSTSGGIKSFSASIEDRWAVSSFPARNWRKHFFASRESVRRAGRQFGSQKNVAKFRVGG